MRNPFEFGRELSSEELVDRDQEMEVVKTSLLSGGKLFLIGPRRYGKTSLIHAATQELAADDVLVLRYDAQAFPSLEQLAARLAGDAAQLLAGSIEKVGKLIAELFASVRPTAIFDPKDHKWAVTLVGAPGRERGSPLLADVLDGVERAAAKARRRVAIVIDEFQEVVEDGGVEAEEQIRAAIQRHRNVGYVFAGSATRLLADMVTGPNRPFYRMGKPLFLGPVPRADFAAFLERGFARAGIPLAPGATDAILDCAEEVPYNVQLLAHACWIACRPGGDAASGRGKRAAVRLTPELVRKTHDTEALRHDPFYTQLWTSLPTTQRRALLAVLQERGVGLTSTPVARRHQMPITTMQRAIEALEDKQVIREDQTRGTVRLRLEDPLFGAWIRLIVKE